MDTDQEIFSLEVYMFSLSWERDGGKGVSVKAWNSSLVSQSSNPSAHILLQGVTRHKTFGHGVRNGFGTAASQREEVSAVASAGRS